MDREPSGSIPPLHHRPSAGGPPPRGELGEELATRFAGYAAVFDRVDRGGDVVRRGAFAGASADVPLLWQHGAGTPIGRVERIGEDAHGLRVIGRLTGETQAGREAGALLRAGAITGLSFGYRVRKAAPFDRLRVSGSGAARELTALELVEISLVTFPMQPLAKVHAVESPSPTGRGRER